jgi:glycosyltransferase 2 family protein
MSDSKKNPFKGIRTTNVIYPIIFGLGVVIFMFIRKFDPSIFRAIHLTPRIFCWIGIAVLLMVMRDFGYMIRIRVLSDNELSWLKSFRIIMLWEFTSAITPSAVGGTSVAIIYVNKEGIGLGKSSAIVMATSFLDELYFIIAFPLVLILIKAYDLFNISGISSEVISFTNEFLLFAILGYSVKFIYLIVLSYGLFINPRGLKWLLLWIFKLPILRRWRQGANEAGTEIISSSRELTRKPVLFWLKAFGATSLSWTSRYFVVNALFLAFFFVPDHLLLYARQLAAWIMMLVSPTPGGSGFSEYIFIRYFGGLLDIAPSLKESFAALLSFIWRLISYYPYLLIGTVIFPRWIKMKFGSGMNPNEVSSAKSIR